MFDCLVNGELSGHVAVDDRGLHYGDGIFETVAVIHGQPRFWQGHMDRLAIGCETLGLPRVPQALLLRELQTVSAGLASCVVKILLTRISSGRGYRPGTTSDCNRVVAAYPFPEDAEQFALHGVDARICNFRLALQPALAGIKHLNRLEQVLAAAELARTGTDEGILLDSEDYVISALSGNLFLVVGDRLLTPRMDRAGVRGVMRGAILQAFKARCEQRRVTLDMLRDADEVFCCNAVRGIVPVRRIGQWIFEPGPRTRELQEWLKPL
ncbi:aminodeoxychorismate lyase [Wenzhouxiangellaceae bacterium CH-27]|uniref:Aminodeoxychorismate lyase n=2 Tax=Elongatibacter sediminis TaxID=3119006 RepID=A0AAW9RJ16_9GAMM